MVAVQVPLVVISRCSEGFHVVVDVAPPPLVAGTETGPIGMTLSSRPLRNSTSPTCAVNVVLAFPWNVLLG